MGWNDEYGAGVSVVAVGGVKDAGGIRCASDCGGVKGLDKMMGSNGNMGRLRTSYWNGV